MDLGLQNYILRNSHYTFTAFTFCDTEHNLSCIVTSSLRLETSCLCPVCLCFADMILYCRLRNGVFYAKPKWGNGVCVCLVYCRLRKGVCYANIICRTGWDRGSGHVLYISTQLCTLKPLMKDMISRVVGLSCQNLSTSVWWSQCKMREDWTFKNWKQKTLALTGNDTEKTTQDYDLGYLNELLQKFLLLKYNLNHPNSQGTHTISTPVSYTHLTLPTNREV